MLTAEYLPLIGSLGEACRAELQTIEVQHTTGS